MYSIAICDDEQYYLDEISDAIEDIFLVCKKEYRLDKFSCAQLLYDKITTCDTQYDMIILDILMGDENGIDLAKKIRAVDGDTSILFLTSSPDFVFEGYDVLASGYFLKPVDTEKLKVLIENNLTSKNKKKYVVIKENGVINKIKCDDIVYIESNGKKIEINTTEGKHSTYVKLSDVLKEFDNNVFVNCHKSYIINLNHVKSIVSTGFHTQQGYFVPISRSNYQMAKKSFIHFIGS